MPTTTQRGCAMQLLAMLTMLIDHIGLVWFPEQTAWRIVGRLAFPLYAYALVIGYFRTRSRGRYLQRLGVIALLSQIPYMAAFSTYEGNVVITLFICLLALLLLDRLQGKLPLQVLAAAAFVAMLELIPLDYGGYALLLVLIYRYAKPSLMLLLHLLLNAAAVWFHGPGWMVQFASVFATLLVAVLPDMLRELDRIRIPRFAWRSFYPVHLAAIAVIHYAQQQL